MVEDKGIGYILHKAAMMNKNNLTSKLNAFGITPGQFTVIKEIYYHKINSTEVGLSPACIADRIECDRPTVSGMIDRLEEQQWIVRLQNPEDKRSCIIQVTDKVIDNMEVLEKIQNQSHNVLLNGFTQEEKALFTSYLLRVIDNLRGLE